jgi:hypothetical protein
MRIATLAVTVLFSLSGCTFVKMAPGANEVQVVGLKANMSACEKRGEVVVSVKNRLGPYERDEMRVLDELETLARNEAPGLQADTVQPKNLPQDGEQRFVAYRCAGAAVARPDEPRDSAETVPLKEQ